MIDISLFTAVISLAIRRCVMEAFIIHTRESLSNFVHDTYEGSGTQISFQNTPNFNEQCVVMLYTCKDKDDITLLTQASS